MWSCSMPFTYTKENTFKIDFNMKWALINNNSLNLGTVLFKLKIIDSRYTGANLVGIRR